MLTTLLIIKHFSHQALSPDMPLITHALYSFPAIDWYNYDSALLCFCFLPTFFSSFRSFCFCPLSVSFLSACPLASFLPILHLVMVCENFVHNIFLPTANKSNLPILQIIKTVNAIVNLPLTLFPSSQLPHRVSPFLYFSDESNLKMNSVDHIPQTLASHIRLPEDSQPQGLEGGSIVQHGADMLKPDPRDTFYSSKSATHHFSLPPFFSPHAGFLPRHFPRLTD